LKAVINLHPILSDELLTKMGIQFTDYSFEYDTELSRNQLITEAVVGQEHIQSKLTIKDELEIWNYNSHNLILNRRIMIHNLSLLFGTEGVAGQQAEIGTAVMWSSKHSSQRGIFIGESFKISSVKRQFIITGEFPKGTLRDRFELKTILYIKKPGVLSEREGHLAHKAGFILGDMDETVIHLKGSGSIFPIFTVNEDGPLWRVECNWDDPRSDSFDDEYVRILINENHPDFKFIKAADKKRLSPLMKEIIASSIQIIMGRVQSQVDLQDIIEGKDVESGSVCMAIQYFIQTFDLNASSPEDLAYSMRNYLDQKTGGTI